MTGWRRLAGCATPIAMALAGCAPVDPRAPTGDASGSFDCEIFQPGANPPNYGDGVIELRFAGDERTLAQGAASFAIDAEGSQTLDPANAAYFAIQVYQDVSESKLELFELRVLPAEWLTGEVQIDGDGAVGFLGEVLYDANRQVLEARIVAETRAGVLVLDQAGNDPREAVRGSLRDVLLSE